MSKGRAERRVALALVHYPIRDRQRGIGATSVTPLNIHDMARCAVTYGAEPLYVVTPILSQQALAGRILRHWLEGYGGTRNPSRRESLGIVSVVSSVNEASQDLFGRTGAYPRLVGTGARERPGSLPPAALAAEISASADPWLILFGTGWGLAPEILDQCDRHLQPIRGGGEFNHLPVRAAAAIVLDRLFGK